MGEADRVGEKQDKEELVPGEEQEFRIYVSDCGDEPIVKDICGTDALKEQLEKVRKAWPLSTIVICEVLESVVKVILAPDTPPPQPPIKGGGAK